MKLTGQKLKIAAYLAIAIAAIAGLSMWSVVIASAWKIAQID